MITINASLHSLKRDKEGAVKLVFEVPESDAAQCFSIPTMEILLVTVATSEEIEGRNVI